MNDFVEFLVLQVCQRARSVGVPNLILGVLVTLEKSPDSEHHTFSCLLPLYKPNKLLKSSEVAQIQHFLFGYVAMLFHVKSEIAIIQCYFFIFPSHHIFILFIVVQYLLE